MSTYYFKIRYNDGSDNKVKTTTIKLFGDSLVLELREKVASACNLWAHSVSMKTGLPKPTTFQWTSQSLISEVFSEKRTLLIVRKGASNCEYITKEDDSIEKADSMSVGGGEGIDMDVSDDDEGWGGCAIDDTERAGEDADLFNSEHLEEIADDEVFSDRFIENRVTKKTLDKTKSLKEIELNENNQSKWKKGTYAKSQYSKYRIISKPQTVFEDGYNVQFELESVCASKLTEYLQDWYRHLTDREDYCGVNSIPVIISIYVGPQEWEAFLTRREEIMIHVHKRMGQMERKEIPVYLWQLNYLGLQAMDIMTKMANCDELTLYKSLATDKRMSFKGFLNIMHNVIFETKRPEDGNDLFDREMLTFAINFDIVYAYTKFEDSDLLKTRTIFKSND